MTQCLHVHGPICYILTALRNTATQNKLTRMPYNTCNRQVRVPQTHLISPLGHAGICPLPVSAMYTFCRTARGHSHPTLIKRGQTQRMPSEQLQKLCRWSLWWAQASMPSPMAHSIAHPPGASVVCTLWLSLVTLSSPGRDLAPQQFANPFQRVWCLLHHDICHSISVTKQPDFQNHSS